MEYLKEIGKTGIKPVVLEEIINFAQKYQIKQVILFGSRARGDFYRASDIDLAVHGGNVIGFTLAAKEETSTLLDFDVVDLDKSVDKKFLDSHRFNILDFDTIHTTGTFVSFYSFPCLREYILTI